MNKYHDLENAKKNVRLHAIQITWLLSLVLSCIESTSLLTT